MKSEANIQFTFLIKILFIYSLEIPYQYSMYFDHISFLQYQPLSPPEYYNIFPS